MKKKLAILIGGIFFVLGLLTLPDYGINWDTINHLPRGQVYLNFFLTGRRDFPEAASWKKYHQKENTLFFSPDVPKEEVPRVSLYQNAGVNYDYYLERDGGHPPLSDILSSVFNLIFFQKLGLINDIDSYRVYGILLASILVGLVFYWGSKAYGRFAGLIAALSLATYPLFFSESHFNNEKDIPEITFWALAFYSVWKGVKEKNWRWILGSGVFFGLALGTKFNILFSAFAIIPWLVVVLLKTRLKDYPRPLFFSLLLVPVIALTIFVASWPYLWPDIIVRAGKIVNYYTDIGLTDNPGLRFTGPFGISTLPLVWIITTTPPVTLILFIVGVIFSFTRLRKEKYQETLLFLLWFLVPVARVTWPGTTIYGGIRQIMEYLPAMALLSGLGAKKIADFIKKKAGMKIAVLSLTVPFVILAGELYQMHPNENVYFNFLMGGLSGAERKNIPFWGNSFGAAYRQGVVWLNENAEPNARVVFAHELYPNIPYIWFRSDIKFQNSYRSGFAREGEYAITLTYQGTAERSYFDTYLEKFLEPVYEVKVDGVSILKIWKNDLAHTRKNFLRTEPVRVLDWQAKDGELVFELEDEVFLSHIDYTYSELNCSKLKNTYVYIASQVGNWKMLKDNLPGRYIASHEQQPRNGRLIYPFAAQKARFIKFSFTPVDACIQNVKTADVYHLLDLLE